jgi:RNA-splicing ligase RtcB
MNEQRAECWSVDGSDFSYTSLGDLLDGNDDIEVGQVVHVGDPVHPDATEFVDAGDVIDLIATRAYDIGHEHADDFPDVTDEARAELDALLQGWITKHCKVTFYEVENAREYVITAEDLEGVPTPTVPQAQEPR